MLTLRSWDDGSLLYIQIQVTMMPPITNDICVAFRGTLSSCEISSSWSYLTGINRRDRNLYYKDDSRTVQTRFDSSISNNTVNLPKFSYGSNCSSKEKCGSLKERVNHTQEKINWLENKAILHPKFVLLLSTIVWPLITGLFIFFFHLSVMPQPPDPAQLPPKPFNPTPQATQGSEFDYQPQFQWWKNRHSKSEHFKWQEDFIDDI